jgi:nitrite reductase/ring-hydroxylating ferredoxin subunit
MSETAYDTITECIGSLTEDEAISAIVAINTHFGFSGTVFTREDAQQEWQNQQYDPETGETPDTPMPDDAWQRVQDTWAWSKGLSDILTERGWELVSEAVAEALDED